MAFSDPPALASAAASPADSDYDTILAAVMETARGRWFLDEYLQRHRNPETGALLLALERIELRLSSAQADIDNPARNRSTPAAAIVSDPKTVSTVAADLLRLRDRLRDIADSLAECGAPSFLYNDLRRCVQEVARICDRHGGDTDDVPAPAPAQVSRKADPPLSPAAKPDSDPFADILALSLEEKIALFT